MTATLLQNLAELVGPAHCLGGARAVVTANPGCILQLAAGLRARGRDDEALHVVEVLDRAYAAAERAQP